MHCTDQLPNQNQFIIITDCYYDKHVGSVCALVCVSVSVRVNILLNGVKYLRLRLVMTYSKTNCGRPCGPVSKPCCQSAPSYPDFCGLCHAKTPIIYQIPLCDIPNHNCVPYKPTKPAPVYPETPIVATFNPISYLPVSVRDAVPQVSSTSGSDSTGYWDIPSYTDGCDC